MDSSALDALEASVASVFPELDDAAPEEVELRTYVAAAARYGTLRDLSRLLVAYGVDSDNVDAQITFLLEDASQKGLIHVESTREKIAAQLTVADEAADDWGVATVAVGRPKNEVDNTLESERDAKKRARRLEKERRREELEVERRLRAEEAARVAEDDAVKAQGMRAMEAARAGLVHGADVRVEFNLSVGVAGLELFKEASLRLVRGRKYGLLGRNGIGKSSLLSAISRGELEGFPSSLSVLHVAQEVVGHADITVEECVLRGHYELWSLLRERDILESTPDVAHTGARAKEVYARLDELEADTYKARIQKLLLGLGFTPTTIASPTATLSGGWRMRAALARALFFSPHVLMLDEPTNHLSLRACLWLERYLTHELSGETTLLLVSHDRSFLNSVVEEVIHVEDSKLFYYKGNIDSFEKTRSARRLDHERTADATKRRVDHMQKFVDKFRYNAKRASLAQSRIKAINKITILDDLADDPTVNFQFPDCGSEGTEKIVLQGVGFGYDDQNLLFSDVDMTLDRSSRVVLLGENGAGKTTLAKLILNELIPTKGTVSVPSSIKIGVFRQHALDSLDPRKDSLTFFIETKTATLRAASRRSGEPLFVNAMEMEESTRSHLAKFGVDRDLAARKIGLLSGGQKARVAFALVTLGCPDLLILDEPTNHLDLESNAALVAAILAYDGGVLLISHDESAVSTVAETIYVAENNRISEFKGTFAEYKKTLM